MVREEPAHAPESTHGNETEPELETDMSKKRNHGEFTFTLEEFEMGHELLTLELDVTYTMSPFHAATMYRANGDLGDPAEGGEIEDLTAVVTLATDGENDYSTRDTTDWRIAKLAEVQAEFNRQLEADKKLREHIDEACYEDAGARDGDRDDRDWERESSRTDHYYSDQ